MLGACFLGATTLPAATYTWDPQGNRSDAAGSGPWDTTTAIWDSGAADVPWPSNNDAVLGGADGTYNVTVANGIMANSVTFNASGYTLSGASAASPGVLTVRGSGNALSVAPGKTLTVGANMTLNAPTYTDTAAPYLGTINVVNGGKLSGGSGASLAGGVNVGANSTANFLSLSLGRAAVTVNGANAAFTTLGSMDVTGSVITITLGTFGATTGNTGISFTSSTVNVNGGTLLLGYVASTNTDSTFNLNGGVVQSSGSYPATFSANGTRSAKFVVQAGGAKIVTSNTVTLEIGLQHDAAGPALDGGLTKTGFSTLTLDAPGTYTGGTTIGGGKLVANVNGALGSGDASVLAVSVSLTIGTGVTAPFSNPQARLTLAGGGTAGTADQGYLDLTSGASVTVGSLVLGTTLYQAGTFSSANFPEYFSGTGTLTVVPEPGSVACLLVLASALAVGFCRRRPRAGISRI